MVGGATVVVVVEVVLDVVVVDRSVVVVEDVEVDVAATDVVGMVESDVLAETDGGRFEGGFAAALENPPVIA